MSLSDRIRPNCEAAPWVIEGIKSMEQNLAKEMSRVMELNREASQLRADVERLQVALGKERDQLLKQESKAITTTDEVIATFRRMLESNHADLMKIVDNPGYTNHCSREVDDLHTERVRIFKQIQGFKDSVFRAKEAKL